MKIGLRREKIPIYIGYDLSMSADSKQCIINPSMHFCHIILLARYSCHYAGTCTIGNHICSKAIGARRNYLSMNCSQYNKDLFIFFKMSISTKTSIRKIHNKKLTMQESKGRPQTICFFFSFLKGGGGKKLMCLNYVEMN